MNPQHIIPLPIPTMNRHHLYSPRQYLLPLYHTHTRLNRRSIQTSLHILPYFLTLISHIQSLQLWHSWHQCPILITTHNIHISRPITSRKQSTTLNIFVTHLQTKVVLLTHACSCQFALNYRCVEICQVLRTQGCSCTVTEYGCY
jgi:hypothetical protein